MEVLFKEMIVQKTPGITDLCLFHTREYRPRENVTFLENGTKVYALNPKTFVFVPEKSAGDPKVDILTTVNIPYVVGIVCVCSCVCVLFRQEAG